ncbi:2-amino-4-hydroxy-6-hydroxymethyldihydropteridine diphosphokinase [Thalassomonas sp. M1454]|uniref:2-amino-4-hydroxy-6- hydroxymethyldihydropteridine diphosphokinase n=1 Tax=Thalassomonas sp. M1454 TaxID=2594477 RepID=UPI00117D6803|nr:2-amino-4-hydroxy-6-hydroxymethyldihydropteridine diphosphokinase [Thalassomonas sp. M1454]TRX52471.1 2-amino-4-hydroxy-6-hydroxymethyldihydropteridine diphosphokinase [Thalassomonas sp. M1454]
MSTVYIGLGSNLDNPAQQLQGAVDSLKSLPETKFILASSLFSSKPMGPQDQPDYMNAVVCIETELSPLALLDQLQAIELAFGRVRKDERWGARVLDLDILLIDDLVIENERLTVPHYGMKVREFVIYPLAQINPELVLPDGSNVTQLQEKIDDNGLIIVGELR